MKKNLLVLFAALSTLGMNAATGGPDTYGYTWIDSNEPNGPMYNWIEIATPAGGSGTYRSAINCDDCHEANIPLGFNFPYYGTNFNTVSIGSNGVVYFENVYVGLSNSCIPGTPSYTMSQYRFIAHLWDDLAPNYQGGIYTQAFPNYFVIEYYDIVPCCSAGDGDTWQVILFSNGNILMQYKELSNQGLQSDFTVGIQNNPTTGLQYKCDATGIALASNRAILFSPPTFSCGSVSQNILPANPGFCTGSSVTLSVGATGIAQAWSTGPTTPSIVVNTIGTYSVYVLDTNGCTLRDTATVVENPLPAFTLGTDVTACGSALLDAGISGMNYLWSDNSTAQTLSVAASGSYSVLVTDPATTCADSDTINVTINAIPVVALGADIAQCEGTVILDAGNPGLDYLWSDNSTSQTLTTAVSGTYAVTVTNLITGCSESDTIIVTINANPAVSLGADTSLCGTSITLDAGNSGLDYLWSDSSTGQMLTAVTSGAYSVTVTDPVSGCMDMDTISVTLNPLPGVNLGVDVEQCGGTVTLDAGNPGQNYLWTDSSTTQTLNVALSGSYSVMVSDTLTGCASSDTIAVTINAVPVVALGADTAICGNNLLLDAGNAGATYLWNDSTSAQTLNVSASGTYYVTVTDPNTLCASGDTINVTINNLPNVAFTLPTTTICVDDASLTLSGGSPAGGTYSGTSVSAGVFDPSIGAGPYVITYSYTDSAGCSNSAIQTINVSACVGINEQENGGVTIYPNPTNGVLLIETIATGNSILVYNSLGEVVANQQTSGTRTSIDLSGLSNGIYFVHVVNAGGDHVQKIILQH